ncbi:carboxypeptidase regulatory-like domain-containing protein [Silvibacterium acidisoli]|uniref:carboxypeptidase regulatory-like domain-containing protein n=1 Tax=Acidobacteriaceae bacterium ZG23-2 TaxID=2883246 RepID=UPI00406C88CB
MTRSFKALALALFAFVFVATAFAQNATTSLRGTIKDASGAVVPGAKITITDPATGRSIDTVSKTSGEYSYVQIPPAKYVIKISATGFGDQTKTAELLVNQPATIDFALSVQASQEVVNVSAEAQTLNTSDASLGNSVNNTEIQALPSETRNVPDLLSLQPGVLFLPQPSNPLTQDSRSGAVNGGRSDQGNVTLDGVDDNDQVYGVAFTGVLRETQDSIEEFRVTTGNANADAGRSSGAQISLVTKSGTNQFHGGAYEYYRPTFTVANDWFNKQAQLASGEANVPGKIVRNIFGVAVGGPIKKDKLFFFANYEGTRKAENTQVTRTVPTASYKQGNIQYLGDTSNGGTANEILTAAQITQMDAAAGCQVCNTAQYPFGPGPNPNALAYFQSMPTANGTLTGDGGYNTGSYSFSSPNPQSLNTVIARIDYQPSDKHRIFVRGNLQKDTTQDVEQFPGQGPSDILSDNTKGITAGETWTITPNLVNDIRYGYIRQGNSIRGVGSGDYVDFRYLDTATAETRTTVASVPVNNIVDNLNWNKGKHNIQLGVNWRLVHQNRSSDAVSFNSASSNPAWLGDGAPAPNNGIPVDGGFTTSYNQAYANLVGTIPSVTDIYNYQITGPDSGSLLGDGAFIDRHFKANEYEYYLQDSWRATSKLTLTFGIRHTLLQTPWETKGQEVAPTIDTHAWYMQREAAAQKGEVYEPLLNFQPAGPYYNRPGYWAKSKNNIAPRFAFAYSPDEKTSIRGGFGIYYDHFGEALVNTFDQNGSFGMSSSVTNPAGLYGNETAPRFTGRQTLPFSNGTPSPTVSFPFAPSSDTSTGFAITWGLDNKMKTPYTEAIDFSVQRQLPSGFTLETTYVGRMGRHLLQSLDLAEPVDLVDQKGGGDYFNAAAKLSKYVDQNGGYSSNASATSNQNASVPAIQYFEDVFPFMAGVDYPGESATQAIYTNEWAFNRAQYGETTSLADVDFYCAYGCPADYVSQFWQSQFSSLYALSTMGTSYYNAAQITLRHPASHGLAVDVSYTYSHSIDMGSDTERSTEFGNAGGNGVFEGSSSILNTWKPQLNRSSSDFDTRHLLTADWVYQLPVGKGKAAFGNANTMTNAIIGGWQLSGILRATSGLPFSLYEPGWTTDWQQSSFAVKTGNVKMRRHMDPGAAPQAFDNPNAINSGVNSGGPIRLPYPGEAGERNAYRGDGYFNLDSGLSKSWGFKEFGALKLTWEVYNVTNTVRFDVQSIINSGGATLTQGNLGSYNSMLTTPRRQQFSLRYDF